MTLSIIDKLAQCSELISGPYKTSQRELMNLESALDEFLNQPKAKLFEDILTGVNKKTILVWSDGSCLGNPGPGGWGTIVEIDGKRKEYSGGSRKTTNNIMELTGAIEGIKQTPEGCSIVLTSDSQYLIKGMSEWLAGWKKKSWKKADGKSVLNQELWQELDALAANRKITWKWIKGHAGHPENERCDELAKKAITQ